MDRRERSPDSYSALKEALDGWQAKLWTALPARITKYSPDAMTCECQPVLQALLLDRSGFETWVTLPLLVDVPVMFPGAGGFTLTFPVVAGDEVLVVFSSRCIDAWWQSGGVQQQAELRMHDLSDGFAVLGARNQTRLVPSINTTAVQLRNDAGDAFVEIAADASISATTPTTVTATANHVDVIAPTATFSGNVTVQGTLTVQGLLTYSAGITGTGTALNNGTNVGSTHHHTYIDSNPSSPVTRTSDPPS